MTTQTPHLPPQPSRRGVFVLAIAAALGAGVLAATLLIVRRGRPPEGMVEVTNRKAIGEHLTQLKALEACEVSYGAHSRYAPELRFSTIVIKPCESSDPWARVAVAEGARQEPLHFELQRSRPTSEWTLYVDPSTGDIDDLQKALTTLVPLVTAQGPELLRAERAKARDARADEAERVQRDRERKRSNADSFR